MIPYFAPGTRVLTSDLRGGEDLRRIVVEHLTVGPRAGWVRLQKPDGSIEHRTADTLRYAEPPRSAPLPEYVEFYDRTDQQVIERHRCAEVAGQLTFVRAEIARVRRLPERRIGVRVAA